jgi:tRNA A-37 threonylcarbamoyl transferase component Bud32
MAAAPPQTTCVLPEDCAAFLSGHLDEAATHALELHIDSCADCRELLSALAKTEQAAQRSRPPLRPLGPSAASISPTLPLVRDDFALAFGARVGRYVVRKRLGAGAMGVVYAAYDPELNREVALKVLRDQMLSPDQRVPLADRLRREAQAMAQLAHPNVVAVHDVGSVNERLFIAMELVDGQTLTQWLDAERRDWRAVLRAFIDAGRGLAAAHAAALVHRDFKPDNVLVGSDGRVRVTDFGLAHTAAEPATPGASARFYAMAEARRTETRELAGTPYYMAPEQYFGEATDARTDQFSFCVALYSALTGEHPFGQAPLQNLAAVAAVGRSGPSRRRNGLPRWLRRVLLRGLAISPADRHPSMEHLLASLTYDRKRVLWLRLTGATLVAALLGGGLVAWRTREARAACKGAERRLTDVWDAQRIRTVGRAFMKSGMPRAGIVFTEVERRLDRYSQDWVTMQTEACEAAHTGGDRALLELRVQCLDARLLGLRHLTDRLARGDAQTLAEASAETQDLGDLAVCLDDKALSSAVRPDVAARAAPALMVDGSGIMTYVARKSDGTLWRGWQEGRGTGTWHDGKIDDGVAGDPVALLDGDQRVNYFVRKRDGWLWHAWQERRDGGDWHAIRLAPAVVGKPAVVLDGARRLSYFVRKSDGTLWHGFDEGGRWHENQIFAAIAGDPAACVDREGNLTYFVRRADGSLWRGWQDTPGNARWNVEKIDDGVAGDPVVALDVADKLTGFVRMMDGTLRAFYQIEAGSSVWGYVELTGQIAGNPTLTEDGARKQHCWARTPDGALWHGWQSGTVQGPWHDETLTRGLAGDPAAALAIDKKMTYLIRMDDGALWYGTESAPGKGPWHSTQLGSGAP